MKKVFGAALLCEVNTFSPLPTTEEQFTQCYYVEDGKHGTDVHYYAQPLLTMKKLVEAEGWDYKESLCAGAQPGGKIQQQTYEKYRDKILTDLKAQLPVDAVFLYLHGAMVSEACDDCEGEILSKVRKIAGPEVFIGVELDPHAHLTDKMVENSNALVFIKEYPHTDYNERAIDIFNIMKGTLAKKIIPVMSVADCHMIGMYATTLEPMNSFNRAIQYLERETENILSISVIHGFPWGDVEDIGTKILIITNNYPPLGKETAEELSQELQKLQGKTMPKAYHISEALNLAISEFTDKPIVLADFSDNTGLGALGDSTFILAEVFSREISGVALSPLYDPEAVKVASIAGEGSKIDITIGGKGQYSGHPLILYGATIKKIEPNLTANFAGTEARYGTAVALSHKGVDIVINNNRCQTFSTECFSKMGIDPLDKKILIVKSSEHFRKSFQEITDKIFIVTTPGTISLDFSEIPYKKILRNL